MQAGSSETPAPPEPAAGERHFIPCINEVSTLGAPFERECAAYSAAGFKHVELWFPKLANVGLTASQVAATLRGAGLQPVVACALDGYLARSQGELAPHLPEAQKNFELAQALGIPSFIVYTFVGNQDPQDDYQLAAERLYQIAELASKHKVKVALEFCAGSRFIGSLATALSVMRTAAHADVGICLDTFHFFAGVSNTEDLLMLRPGEIVHVHFHDAPGDIPRERMADPDRVPPGEGIFPLLAVTAALRRLGYSSNLSVELFGAKYQNGEPEAVARNCYNAVLPYC